jgi:hypothetical protein
MVNWRRLFKRIWVQLRWLQSFREINDLAAKDLTYKFISGIFVITDNTVKLQIETLLQEIRMSDDALN